MAWKFTDFRNSASFAVALRRRRLRHFLKIVDSLPGPVRILDVGGTDYFWETMGVDLSEKCHVTLLNINKYEVDSPHFISIAGDARDLSQFTDGHFDIAFSNSVIEHVGTYVDQASMAAELQRVAKYYFVQTPNRWFPIEPHFQFPLFQFLPRTAQVYLLTHFSIGWYPKTDSVEQANEWADEIRLLSKGEMRQLFPHARIVAERFCGLAKSYMAVHGPALSTSA